MVFPILPAARDVPFSQRIPLFPLPKPKASPPSVTVPQDKEYPSDAAAQVEWYEKIFKQLFNQSVGFDEDIVAYRKQLMPEGLHCPTSSYSCKFRILAKHINHQGPCRGPRSRYGQGMDCQSQTGSRH